MLVGRVHAITLPGGSKQVLLLPCEGAEVERVRPVSITHPGHHVNVAHRRALSCKGAVFADQFANAANFRCLLQHSTTAMLF